jgi:hypothetical protein
MTIQFVTFFSTLCELARKEYLAEKSGDSELIEKAKNAHEAYRELCLKSKMIIPNER